MLREIYAKFSILRLGVSKDGRPFTFAGLWENWKDPESGEWLRTCTITYRRA
jgi:putative SOS response-associated peptidase YedK